MCRLCGAFSCSLTGEADWMAVCLAPDKTGPVMLFHLRSPLTRETFSFLLHISSQCAGAVTWWFILLHVFATTCFLCPVKSSACTVIAVTIFLCCSRMCLLVCAWLCLPLLFVDEPVLLLLTQHWWGRDSCFYLNHTGALLYKVCVVCVV